MYFQSLQCETVIFLFVQVSVVLTWNDNTRPYVLYPGIMVYVDHLHVHFLLTWIIIIELYEEFLEKLTNQFGFIWIINCHIEKRYHFSFS